MPPARRNRRLLAVAALAIALAAFPLGVLASHQFADVPNSNPFHADIDALADSGVTSGCGGGNFCPSAFVTREQMAAFMNRLGALAAGKVPVVNADKVDGLTSDQFLRSDVPVIGHVGCAGSGMQPLFSAAQYSSAGALRYFDAGSGAFVCPLTIPDGATITALVGNLLDFHDGLEGYCALNRYTLADAGSLNLAQTGSSGATFQSGATQLIDDTITEPVVTNELFTYQAECSLSGFASNMAIISVLVAYTVTGPAVP